VTNIICEMTLRGSRPTGRLQHRNSPLLRKGQEPFQVIAALQR
jgi:hypothetical protein